jgi:hypothetical protein
VGSKLGCTSIEGENMIEKVKALGGVLLGIAIFVCVLAVPVVFITS